MENQNEHSAHPPINIAPTLNIYQRINEVRKKVLYVRKDKRIDGKYNAVTHDQVTAMLRASLVEQGLLVVPSQVSGELHTTGRRTKSGAEIMRYHAKYDIMFVNVDAPNDQFHVVISSHSMDEGDKAPGKALSYAVKSAMLKVFTLETGENEESRVAAEPEPDPEAKRVLEACTNMQKLAAVWRSLSEAQRKSAGRIKDEMKLKIKGANDEAKN